MNDSILRDMIINEIQILKKLEHPNIIKMIKMLKSTNNIYLVYEFLNGGTLRNYIKEKRKLSEEETVKILSQILRAFNTLQAE